jgi:hypothetical protein
MVEELWADTASGETERCGDASKVRHRQLRHDSVEGGSSGALQTARHEQSGTSVCTVKVKAIEDTPELVAR